MHHNKFFDSQCLKYNKNAKPSIKVHILINLKYQEKFQRLNKTLEDMKELEQAQLRLSKLGSGLLNTFPPPTHSTMVK